MEIQIGVVGRPLPVDQPFLFGVVTNPKPKQTILHFDCQYAMPYTNACRPESTDLLEVKRRMSWIFLEQCEVLVGQLSNVGGQRVVAPPEAGTGEMVHILVDLPA